MLTSLLRLQALAFWRAPYLAGRLALAALKVAGVTYAVGAAAILGVVLPDFLGVVAPGLDPLAEVERWLLPALGALTGVRLVFQSVPTRGAQAFLILPVSQRRVAGSVLVRSLASPLNVASLAFAALFAVRVVSPAAGAGEWKRRVSAFLDAGFLIDYLRPQGYFRFVGGAYSVGTDEVERRAAGYTAFLGEALSSGRLIRDLPLGNAGKVGGVAALVPEPDLAVLDEPFANLDPGARIALEHIICQQGERGATVLVSSHDLDHVVDVRSRVLVLARGRVVRDTPSTPDTLA